MPKCQCTVHISVQDKQGNIKKLTAAGSFKLLWLYELDEPETGSSGILQQVQLSNIFPYTDDRGVVCLSYVKAKVSCEFTDGKM